MVLSLACGTSVDQLICIFRNSIGRSSYPPPKPQYFVFLREKLIIYLRVHRVLNFSGFRLCARDSITLQGLAAGCCTHCHLRLGSLVSAERDNLRPRPRGGRREGNSGARAELIPRASSKSNRVCSNFRPIVTKHKTFVCTMVRILHKTKTAQFKGFGWQKIDSKFS